MFEIDAGKLADEAAFDRIFDRRTNAGISPLLAMVGYRDLLTVETLFRFANATLSTRPIFHSSSAAIRGHVSFSFLALVPHKELFDRCTEAGLTLAGASRYVISTICRLEPSKNRTSLEGYPPWRRDLPGYLESHRHRPDAAGLGHLAFAGAGHHASKSDETLGADQA